MHQWRFLPGLSPGLSRRRRNEFEQAMSVDVSSNQIVASFAVCVAEKDLFSAACRVSTTSVKLSSFISCAARSSAAIAAALDSSWIAGCQEHSSWLSAIGVYNPSTGVNDRSAPQQMQQLASSCRSMVTAHRTNVLLLVRCQC